ncbi:hypothetical protein [Microbacterium sp. SLBN-146]|uniref:hypothetical protein n=1 Tax=Microbacterium sp. SLBN-146 TaxID=2768457 RepID=UPI00114FA6BD|nr:hypothetical protein [Microbacterium sp. SLBN-146]
MGSLPSSPQDYCSSAGWGGNCSVSNTGTQVDVSSSQTAPRGSHDSAGDAPAPRPERSRTPYECSPAIGCREIYTMSSLPEVTADDLASFRPASAFFDTEPEGFAVIGLPTNFVASAGEQELSGELLDWQVTVRFTPVGYLFDYGDGTTQSAAWGGSSWAATGAAQFAPTPTSHIYRNRGSVTPRVTVRYAASVDFGTGWRPVSGVVTATTVGGVIEVLEARTALVEHTCRERPDAAGC